MLRNLVLVSLSTDFETKSETLTFQSSEKQKCPACYKINEGKGLKKTFCYGGTVSTSICATCRTTKRRTARSGKIATLKMPRLLSANFCVDLHRMLTLLGVCRIIPSTPDTTLSVLASKLVQSCEEQLPIDEWQTFKVEDNEISRRMFNVS